jgi:hypothetical protein
VLLALAASAEVNARDDWHGADIENDAELSAAAKKAADAWAVVAGGLVDYDWDNDEDGFYEGTIKKLVARAKRRAREDKKREDNNVDIIREARRENQSAVDKLVAKLVALDRNVARGVFECLAIRGPCGLLEGVNFVLSEPFAIALQKALAEAPSCAAPTTEADDGLDIPDYLRPTA